MNTSLIVADVGNSSIHLAEFLIDQESTELPVPIRSIDIPSGASDFDTVDRWFSASESQPARWLVGSVNSRGFEPLQTWLQSRNQQFHVVTYKDLDIPIVAKSPDKIGIDRLASATAANLLRSANCAAIIVDAGTAITIDCVSASGQFIGGLIAPGVQSGFALLAQNTDKLPLISLDRSPGLIADNTTQAIQSGVYWMAVGGIENTIAKMKNELASPCDVFVTGGSMKSIYPNLQLAAEHVPHLVLSGLATAKL